MGVSQYYTFNELYLILSLIYDHINLWKVVLLAAKKDIELKLLSLAIVGVQFKITPHNFITQAKK